MGECINQQVDWGITPTEPWLVWIYETFWGFILGSLIPFNRPLIGWGLQCRLECRICETGAGHRWQEWLGVKWACFFCLGRRFKTIRLNKGWFQFLWCWHPDAPDLERDPYCDPQLVRRSSGYGYGSTGKKSWNRKFEVGPLDPGS